MRWTEKYTHEKDSNYRFVFKREALLDRDIEATLTQGNAKAIQLLCGEARENVLNGRYPCSPYDAVILAALTLQSRSGDLNEVKYKPGNYLYVLGRSKDLMAKYC